MSTHFKFPAACPVSPANPITSFRSNEEPAVKPPPQRIQIDPQSHAPYNPSVHVPFDLYFAPKPIVGKDPRECFGGLKPLKKTFDRHASHINTLLPPTIPVQQIDDEDDLRVVIQYTYSQLHKLLMEESALSISNTTAVPRRIVPEGNDLRYKPSLYPEMPPGWITAARHWDSLQNRGLGDPFKTFWTRRGPEVECGCCCNPLPNMLPKETVEEIDNLINENKLTVAYDVTKTGYGGYRPICAKGVPLAKKTTC